MIKEIVGSNADIEWDTSKPDGTPKKQLDVSLLESMGWKHKIEMEEGISSVYKSYLA